MKMYSIIWGVICVGIFALLTIYGLKFAEVKDYLKLEDKIESVVEEHNKDLETEEIVQTKYSMEDILGYDNELKLSVKKDKCICYVEGDIFLFKMRYKAYIKCKKYETKGYEEETNEKD